MIIPTLLMIHVVRSFVRSTTPISINAQDSIIFVFLFLQNIRVVAQYYTRIRMQRLAELLSLSLPVSGWLCPCAMWD